MENIEWISYDPYGERPTRTIHFSDGTEITEVVTEDPATVWFRYFNGGDL